MASSSSSSLSRGSASCQLGGSSFPSLQRSGGSSPIPYRERPQDYSPDIICHCRKKASRWISWSDADPGRRYLTCARAWNGGCIFWSWYDPETQIRGAVASSASRWSPLSSFLTRHHHQTAGSERWKRTPAYINRHRPSVAVDPQLPHSPPPPKARVSGLCGHKNEREREKGFTQIPIQMLTRQAMQKGVAGISVYSVWLYPLTNSTMDLEATKRCMDFRFGWILEPLVFGDYPQIMKKIVGSRLPSFTKVQAESIKGSIDFIGINHYYSLYVSDRPLDKGVRDYAADMSVYYRGSKTDPPIGQHAPTSIPNDPEGLQLMLQYLNEAYGGIPIYVEESGTGSSNDTVQDTDKIEYLKSYIGSTLTALRNGANVKGYFVWAFMDVFEVLSGYQSRYGLYRVDFDDEARPRQARLSARWYSGFLKNSGVQFQNELVNAGSHAQQ